MARQELFHSPITPQAVELTRIGKTVFELMIVDRSLRNHRHPKVSFAMSEELVTRYSSRREELCQELGMPADEERRRRTITGYKRRFREHGLFPFPDLPVRRNGRF